MSVLRWLGYIALAGIVLTVLLAILAAIRVIAFLGGLIIAIALIAMLLKAVHADKQQGN